MAAARPRACTGTSPCPCSNTAEQPLRGVALVAMPRLRRTPPRRRIRLLLFNDGRSTPKPTPAPARTSRSPHAGPASCPIVAGHTLWPADQRSGSRQKLLCHLHPGQFCMYCTPSRTVCLHAQSQALEFYWDYKNTVRNSSPRCGKPDDDPIVDDDDDASTVRPRCTSSALQRSRSTSIPRLARACELHTQIVFVKYGIKVDRDDAHHLWTEMTSRPYQYSAVPLHKTLLDICEASVHSSVLLVGQRMMYEKPSLDADVLDESELALWCWR
ncbi:unnamed protein product [Miscanthus lutarioriparius]|uniref:Uncharacterized protein n=1 Tax=Miscanthus lutarioriparius TaxID=422564 RepID=A0A811NPT2_9POAL|nr:unnamed protein product [Miscanthus lutarioriparius]